MIGADPAYYLTEKINRWSGPNFQFDKEVVAEYLRCFNRETIHSSCEDYRAAATIDLAHDRANIDKKFECPLLALWGSVGFINKTYDVLSVWNEYAEQVTGRALENCGHFLPEEAPQDIVSELLLFLD